MRRVGKGFSGVKTPLFEGMIADRQTAYEELGAEQVQVDAADDAAIEDVVETGAENVSYDAALSSLPHEIPSPSQEPSSPPQQRQRSPQAPPQDAEFPTQLQQVLNVCSALSKHVEHLETNNAAQKLVIVKLKARVKKLEKANKIKSSKLRRLRKVGTSRRVESSDDLEDVFNQGRMFDDMDMNEGIELVKEAEVDESEGTHDVAKQVEKQAKMYNIDLDHSSKVLSMLEDDLEVQEVVEVVTTAKLITEVTDAASQVSTVSTTIPAVKEELSLKTSAKTPAETLKVLDKGKGIMIEAPKPLKKKDQIELDAEYARKLHKEINKDDADFNKDVDWDAAMEHVNQKSSTNPQYIKRYHGIKKRPQTESEARKNMMIYLKNNVGYKMDFFKGMSYADICPIFQARFDENIRFLFKTRKEMEAEDEEIIKSINETPAQKVAKRRKLNKEAQEAEALKKQLEIVHDEDDDVFIEATLIGRKYIQMIDYALWEVIENGATLPRTKVVEGVTTVMPITTIKEKAQRRLEVKERSTLMMGIPNEHQLKFNSIKDANQLLKAVKKRFKVKRMSSSKSSTQNMAFMSSSNNNSSSTNGVVNTAQVVNTPHGVSTANTQVNTANIDNLSDAVIFAFLASQPNSPQLVHEDLEQIHLDDLEEIDLRWQMAMLTLRARSFLKKIGRKLSINGNETIGYDKSSLECYNCHKRGHFARECRALRNQDNKHKESTRRRVHVETPTSKALVSCDGLGLDEFVNKPKVVEDCKAKPSEETPKGVRKNNDASIIEDWVLDNKEEEVT
nr:hypothetical protein [Tanacetum cinerariifolium]